ncbi:MAG: DUF3800 domain-containing protein [Geminicoccaceae bacterium]
MEHSDYIIFADESGDHGLDAIADGFPIFVLVFCVVRKDDYVQSVVPSMQQLKFGFWGHDAVVLHERDIRKQLPPFGFLRTNAELRERFMCGINGLMEAAPIRIYASVIDKRRLVEKYDSPQNPYEIALLFCMERLLSYLQAEGQAGKHVNVLFESRGKREDAELELEFLRITANQANWGYRQPDFTYCSFEPIFVEKKANSTGLQLADLTARPIGLSVLRSGQPNRAMEVILPKLMAKKCFP